MEDWMVTPVQATLTFLWLSTTPVGQRSGLSSWGTSKHDRARGVATDSSGNVYVTGDTYGGLDGNTSAGNADLFVVKYNSSGTKQWTKQLGSSSQDYDYGRSKILTQKNLQTHNLQ